MNSNNKEISAKIEDNITQKINCRQFNALKDDIFNSTDSTNYHNTEVLRTIILKSIQNKHLVFASEVFDDMVALNIVPDDATYTSLMDSLLYEGDTEDAFEIYLHAYLNNVTLDLEIFHSLFERLKKKDISYLEVAYKILKSNLVPSKFIYDHLVFYAQEAKASSFLKLIYEDMNKFGITKVDNPEIYKDSRNYSKKKEKKSRSKSYLNRKKTPIVVIPVQTPNDWSSIQKRDRKDDTYINGVLEDFIRSIMDSRSRSDLSDDSEELGTDGSIAADSGEEEFDEDEIEDEDREAFTSDSDSEN